MSDSDADGSADGEEQLEKMTTGEMIEKMSDVTDDAAEAYENGDLETARLKLAEVNNNLDGVLMQVNIEESREAIADD